MVTTPVRVVLRRDGPAAPASTSAAAMCDATEIFHCSFSCSAVAERILTDHSQSDPVRLPVSLSREARYAAFGLGGRARPCDRGRQRRSGPARRHADRAADAVERAGPSSQPSSAALVGKARQPKPAGPLGREAEPAVVGRVADQQHGAMAAPGGGAQARARISAEPMPRLRCAGSTASGPSSSAGALRAGRDVPQPDGADDAAVLDRDERQPARRRAAGAQPLRRLLEADRAVGGVEQRLAGGGVGRLLMADGEHGTLPAFLGPPACGQGWEGARRSSPAKRGGRQRRCAMSRCG